MVIKGKLINNFILNHNNFQENFSLNHYELLDKLLALLSNKIILFNFLRNYFYTN